MFASYSRRPAADPCSRESWKFEQDQHAATGQAWLPADSQALDLSRLSAPLETPARA
jgi:hypothetical protein